MKLKFFLVLVLLTVFLGACSSVKSNSPGGTLPPISTSQVSSGLTPVAQNSESASGAYPGAEGTPGVVQNNSYAPPVSSGEGTSSGPYPNETQAGMSTLPAGVTGMPGTAIAVDITMRVSEPTTVKLASGGYQFIEFFAIWDPNSKSMSPVVNLLADKYANKLTFTFLDVDDKRNESFKQTLGYNAPPHFFLIDGKGIITQQWLGIIPIEEFETAIQKIP